MRICSMLNTCLLALTLLLLSSCGDNTAKQPDVSHVKVQLETQRLDRDFLQLDTNNLVAGLTALQKKYPDFLNFYLDTIKGLGINGLFTDTSRGISEGLRSYLTYKDYRDLFDTINTHYPNTDQVEADLQKGFQYLEHYYPEYKIPRIIYFNSFLSNWAVVSYEGVIGIGLDMFLGEKYPFYASVGQPDYMYINFRPQSIAPSVFSTVYNDFHPFEDEEKTLLEMMIQKGKQQYFVAKMLPFLNPEDCIGYTKSQLEWCTKNEVMIYNFFPDNGLLFEKNWSKMRRFVVYGPNTAGMPAESPGNIGTWLGLQIVKAYVKEHPGQTLEQLFAENNAEQFLKESRYKPKK